MYKYLINDYEKEVFNLSDFGKIYVIKNTFGKRRPVQFLGYSEDTGKFYIFDCIDEHKKMYAEYFVIELDTSDLAILRDKNMTYQEFSDKKSLEGKAYLLLFTNIKGIDIEANIKGEIARADSSKDEIIQYMIEIRPKYIELDDELYNKIILAFYNKSKE